MSNRNRKKEALAKLAPKPNYRIIPDTHGAVDELRAITDDAIANNLRIMCLGDTVDHVEGVGDTVANLTLMLDLLDADKAEWVMANHEWKHVRGFRNMKRYGNYRVQYHPSIAIARDHMADAPGLVDRLLARADITPFWKRLDDKVFVAHASYHPDMETTDPFWRIPDQSLVARALYGQSNGLEDADGRPIRLLDWVADVPNGTVVVVGHDIRQTEYITHYVNKSGGEVYFADAGCGKNHMTCMYLDYIDGKITSPYPIVTIDFHA